MSRWISMVVLIGATVIAAAVAGWETVAAADNPSLAGRWTLNRTLSQFPREVGFGMDVIPPGAGSDEREGRGAAAFVPRNESEAEARNARQLVDEVRTPSPHLTIVQSETAISITDDQGRSRRFHPDGKDEFQPLDASPVTTTARWEGALLVVRYKVEKSREVRYTYSRKLDPSQLIVQVQFVERGGRDIITRVYEPTRADEPSTPVGAAQAGAQPTPASGLRDATKAYDPNRPALPPAAAEPGKQDVPAVTGAAQAPIGSQKPDAELKGITRLGMVVEGLDSSATTCGLKQDAIEATVSKSLSDAGLKVARNADEDTYVYVNIMTTSMATGFCVSRYDAILYTYTTAKLSYEDSPLLVQVSLLRSGGVAGSASSAHADAVIKGLKQYLDQFAARIRNANK
ncbi:MAG: hypothetical protein NT151_07730 [Acidobacteria bacterium]|nr:hypothetical protein [Acidobacteriota bacterium]